MKARINMLNFKFVNSQIRDSLDVDCMERRSVVQARQESKGQILYILMTKYVKCFILKLQ